MSKYNMKYTNDSAPHALAVQLLARLAPNFTEVIEVFHSGSRGTQTGTVEDTTVVVGYTGLPYTASATMPGDDIPRAVVAALGNLTHSAMHALLTKDQEYEKDVQVSVARAQDGHPSLAEELNFFFGDQELSAEEVVKEQEYTLSLARQGFDDIARAIGVDVSKAEGPKEATAIIISGIKTAFEGLDDLAARWERARPLVEAFEQITAARRL